MTTYIQKAHLEAK